MGEGILIGVDIGGTKTAVVAGVAVNGGLRVLERVSFPTEPHARPWADVVARVTEIGSGLAARHGAPRCVGVSCGGPLDSRAGLIQSPPNLPGWDNVPVTAELSRGLGCPAFLQNDANACALAEWRFGAGRGSATMVFLTFGTGMGAGSSSTAGFSKAQMTLPARSVTSVFPRTARSATARRVHSRASAAGAGSRSSPARRRRRACGTGGVVSWCPDHAALDGITARLVAEAADAGDALARGIFETSGRYLGRGLSLLIDILNPQRIVIGSVFARAGHLMRAAMEAEIAREALPAAARACTIVAAELGEAIGDQACLSVAVDALSRAGGHA